MEQIFQFFRKKKRGMGRRPRNIRHHRNQNLEAGILLSLQIKFDIPSTFLFIPFCTLLLLLPSSSFPPILYKPFQFVWTTNSSVIFYNTKENLNVSDTKRRKWLKELQSGCTKHFKLGVKPFHTSTSATKILSVLYELKSPYVENTFVRLRPSTGD